MTKIDPTVKKETLYISLCSLFFSLLLQVVYFVIDKWSISVLFSCLFGLTGALLNFFLMAYTVQKAVEKEDDKERRNLLKISQSLRMIMLLAFAVLGASLDFFNTWAVLVPMLFPRMAIFIRPLIIKTAKE